MVLLTGVSTVKMAARAAAQEKLRVRSPTSKFVEVSSEIKVTSIVEPESVALCQPPLAGSLSVSWSGETVSVSCGSI